jgi:N utilization substance protein B
MFNRRFLRIKVLQALYAYYQDETPNRTTHERTMFKSLDKAYELYIFMLSLPNELRFYLDKELDKQQSKYFPEEELIMPLKALHNNACIRILDQSQFVQLKLKDLKIKWTDTSDLFKNTWTDLKNNELFREYSRQATHSFAEDKKMLLELYQVFIGESDFFDQYVDERYMNWEDDQVLVTNSLLKTISQMKEDSQEEFILRESSINEDDEAFMTDLFRKTIQQDDELTKLIGDKTKNWETDRIAVIDMLLMKMSLCEIMNFPHIPVKVSINEYLELAKLYSTPNSHGFINGVLDKIQIDLKKENRIQKQGRGLVE